MENKLEEVIHKILVDFPTLEAWQSADGSEIFIKGTSVEDENQNLVGTYCHEGFHQGVISETEIREDCQEFYKEGKR